MNTNLIIKGVALALTLGVASVASAQGNPRQERPRGAQAEGGRGQRAQFGRDGMLLRGITLTESQKTRIAELGAAQRKEMGANRPKRERGDTAGMGARRAEMEQKRAQHLASIRSILDNTQRVQFDKNVAEFKSRVGERGRPEGKGGEKKGRRPGEGR